MPLVIVGIAVLLLLVLMMKFKLNGFIALMIVAVLVALWGVSPELMVLATACGSIAFSHVNDPGFWMFKEYFNLSVSDAIKVRTTYTTTLAVLGIIGVLILSTFITA